MRNHTNRLTCMELMLTCREMRRNKTTKLNSQFICICLFLIKGNMAPSMNRPRSKQSIKLFSALRNLDYRTFYKDVKIILTNPDYSWFIGLLLLFLEIVVTLFVVLKVPCKLMIIK